MSQNKKVLSKWESSGDKPKGELRIDVCARESEGRRGNWEREGRPKVVLHNDGAAVETFYDDGSRASYVAWNEHELVLVMINGNPVDLDARKKNAGELGGSDNPI